MAAKESSSSLASPQTSFRIFVATSLDTHLAMVVSPDDTVGDLKRKIGNEHALCFPNVGEITVRSMKVRGRASFYHLSVAMLVKSAFAGVKGTWFLHIDAVSISLLKNKLGAGKDITGESGGLKVSCNSGRGCADRDKGIVMNMLLAENDLVLPESQTLPDAFSEKLSVRGDSLLPNTESQNLCLQVSSSDPLPRSDTNVSAANLSCLTGHVLQDNFGKSISELGKRSDYDVEQMRETVTEDITMFSAQLQHDTVQVDDEGEKDGRDEDTGNVGARSDDEAVTIKIAKSRKRSRHTVKVSEKASDNVLGEAAALVNSLVVDSTVSFNLNDKKSRRSKKKSGKTELDSELVRTESAYLVKEAENPIEPLEDNHKDHHKQSMSRTAFREAASLDGPVELDSVVVSNNSGKSSRHRKKKTAKTEMLCQSSCNQNADQSIGNHHTDENLEEALRTSNNGSVNECKSIVIPGDTAQDMAQVKHSDTVSTVLFSNLDKEEISQLSSEKGTEENAALLGKTGEGSDKEVSQGFKNRGSAEFNERNDCMEVPKPQSDKINFVAKESQLEPVAKTENRKANKEKTKRKRKLELPSDEQPMFTEKKQVGDSNNHDFVQSLVQPASKELTRKTQSKKTRRTTKSSVNLQVTSSDIASLVKSHDADLPEKEPQDYESDIYDRVPTLMDKNGKDMNMNSTSYDSKLHSLPGNADNHNMPSADAVPQYIDGSARSRHGNAPSAQNHSIVSADIPATEAMDDMPASDDSTKEETPLDNKRCRVAVRKRPTKMSGKVSEKSNQGKITTSTIFGDATSGSSEDEFEIGSRQSAKRTFSDNSTSAGSDRDSDETRTTNLLNSPGVESNPHGKNDRRADGKGNRLIQSPNDKIKNMPLSMVLRSSNSYRKARLTAS